MTVEEAQKVNELYSQLDTLAAENETLKSATLDNGTLLAQLERIEEKLDKLLDKGNSK